MLLRRLHLRLLRRLLLRLLLRLRLRCRRFAGLCGLSGFRHRGGDIGTGRGRRRSRWLATLENRNKSATFNRKRLNVQPNAVNLSLYFITYRSLTGRRVVVGRVTVIRNVAEIRAVRRLERKIPTRYKDVLRARHERRVLLLPLLRGVAQLHHDVQLVEGEIDEAIGCI